MVLAENNRQKQQQYEFAWPQFVTNDYLSENKTKQKKIWNTEIFTKGPIILGNTTYSCLQYFYFRIYKYIWQKISFNNKNLPWQWQMKNTTTKLWRNFQMTNEEHHNQETMKEFSNNSIFGKLTVNDHVPYLLLNGHSTSIFQPIQKKPTITFYHHLLYYYRFFFFWT